MLPAHYIVKGKTKLALKSWDTEKAPVCAYISVSDSGWTKQNLTETVLSSLKKRMTGDYHYLPLRNRRNTEPNIDDLIQQGATLVDLGIHISDDGTIKNADPMLSSGNNSEDI
ncbi:hypothetical protein KUTeg_020769 [Tegillarca granosa]|uniref:Uncharacterized protein n=1 Tax=Tegillarca granosa TaxID=220873 RepID=A0ABQ9EE07_TEGGR|nr:hypothetical protein KUTeg_020769 [Tegillarca granosa]